MVSVEGAVMGVSASSIERPDLGWGSFERECVLHAFLMTPRRTWTSARLSSWYGIRLDLVRAILSELAEERIICHSRGQPDRYRLECEDQRPSSRPGQTSDPPEQHEVDHQPLLLEPGSMVEEAPGAEPEVVSASIGMGAR